MKKILLFSLFLFNASLLDAMANPSTMLKASAMSKSAKLLPADFKVHNADVTVEHRADGTTFVHYIRNGQEMAVFNADLLKQSGMASDMIKNLTFKSSDDMTIDTVKYLFHDLADIEQIKLAIQALDANGLDNNAIKQFVNQLSVDNLAWLSNWTNQWDIGFVYNALTSKVVFDRNIAFDLYNRGLINNNVAKDVSDKVDIDFEQLISQKLINDIILPLYRSEEILFVDYSKDGTHILLFTNRRILIYNALGGQIRVISPQLDEGERSLSAAYSPDGAHILLCTTRKLLIYDTQGNVVQTIIIPLNIAGNFRSAIYDPNGSHILIHANRRILIYNVQGDLLQTIVPQLRTGEIIMSAVYSPDRSHILLCTNAGKLLIYNAQGGLVRTIDPQLGEGEWVQAAVYSPNGAYILVNTGIRLLLYNIRGDQIKIIAPQDENGWIRFGVYSPDGNYVLLVNTEERLLIYNIQGDQVGVITPDERIRSVVYSPDGAYILVVTNEKLIFYLNLQKLSLDLNQKQFILKASEAWKADKPYILSDDEIGIYDSLPDILRDKKFFAEVPSSGEVEL